MDYKAKDYRSENSARRNAIDRCHNPKCAQFKNYGARGITVCESWKGKDGFYNFIRHIGPKPGVNYSLDRIDNSKSYEPGNVKWSTIKEQNNNQRRGKSRKVHKTFNKISATTALEIFNTSGTHKEIAERFGVSTGIVANIKRRICWRSVTAPEFKNLDVFRSVGTD